MPKEIKWTTKVLKSFNGRRGAARARKAKGSWADRKDGYIYGGSMNAIHKDSSFASCDARGRGVETNRGRGHEQSLDKRSGFTTLANTAFAARKRGTEIS